MKEKLATLSPKNAPDQTFDIAKGLSLDANSVIHIQADEDTLREAAEALDGISNYFKQRGVLVLVTPKSVTIDQISEEEMNKEGWYKSEPKNS